MRLRCAVLYRVFLTCQMSPASHVLPIAIRRYGAMRQIKNLRYANHIRDRTASQFFWERGIHPVRSWTTDSCCGTNSALPSVPASGLQKNLRCAHQIRSPNTAREQRPLSGQTASLLTGESLVKTRGLALITQSGPAPITLWLRSCLTNHCRTSEKGRVQQMPGHLGNAFGLPAKWLSRSRATGPGCWPVAACG